MNAKTLTDSELVLRILSGHPDLFGPLIERHLRAAHAVAYARLGNAADAEDAVQEAFLRAYEHLASLRDPARFAAWLLTIARHEASRIAAKRDRVKTSDVSTMDDEASGITAQPDPAQHELNALLRDHVMRLPESAREVVLLHYFAGHSAREIAALLDLNRAAVLKRLQRARETLADTLLRDLETARPTAEDFGKQAVRIAALASALGIKHTASAATVVAGAGAISVAWKALAAVLVVGAIGVVTATRLPNPTAPPASVPVPTDTSLEDLGLGSMAQSQPAIAAVEPNAVQAPVVVAQAKTETHVQAEFDDGILLLDGSWGITGTLPKEFGDVIFLVDLKRSSQEVHASGKAGEAEFEGDGRLIGSVLQLTLYAKQFHPAIGRQHFTLEGTLSASGDSFTLQGKYRTAERTGTVESMQYEPRTELVTTNWKRLPKTDLDFDTFLAQKTREAEQLGDALHRYAKANRKMLPMQIAELVPEYIDSIEPFVPGFEPIVDYERPSEEEALARYRAFGISLGQVFKGEYAPELALPDRLIAYEDELKNVWGDAFQLKPVLMATYKTHPIRLFINSNGIVNSTLTRAGSDPAHRKFCANQRAMCTNNLKQLGLSIKMFMNEAPGEYSPAGWMSIYPEYMPDKNLMSCPSVEPGTASYRLTWPTANVAELRQFHRDRFGDIGRLPDSDIPIVIETHECSHSGGRNVLFLDGRVEYIVGPLEEKPKIAPFLNLR